MAVASECRMRLFYESEIGDGIYSKLPADINVRHRDPKLLSLHVVGKPADAAGFAEIDADTNDAHVTTAATIEWLSGSANDNLTAGGHVQQFITIGIDANNNLVKREENMHATDGTTVVASTNTYKNIFHAFASDWGTGDADAAGQIDIRKLDDTIYISIPAGDNESNGSGFRVPDNHVCMLVDGNLWRKAVSVDEGVIIRIIYIDPIYDGDSTQVAADRCINWFDFCAGGYDATAKPPIGAIFEAGTTLSFWHSSLVDAGEDYDLTLDFLIWKE